MTHHKEVNFLFIKEFANMLNTTTAETFLSNEETMNSTKQRTVYRTQGENFPVLVTYINPTVYTLILAVGMILNGVLLLIFKRHRVIRTTANIMILNLNMSDILNLCMSAPVLSSTTPTMIRTT
jgi:hypothetical protein